MASPQTPTPNLQTATPWIHPSNPPLANAPMLNIATAPLASSVSASGGIGFIAGGYDVSNLQEELHSAAKLIQDLDPTNSAKRFHTETGILPVGVGFLNWGADRVKALEILDRNPVAAVWLFAPREMPGDLVPWVESIRASGGNEVESVGSEGRKYRTQVWVQVGTVREAVACAESLRPDVLVVQGSDAGGHGLAHSASLMTLLPEVRSALLQMSPDVRPHVFAAGGISSGRGLLAARVLGAAGAVMGTRFLGCSEARLASGYQREIVRASDGGISTVRSTVYDRVRGIGGWPERYDGRGVINRSYVDAVEHGMPDEENRRLYEVEMRKGDDGWGENGRMTTYAGTGVGLIKDILPAREILEEVWEETKNISEDMRLM